MILINKLRCLWTLGFCLVASTLPYKVPTITDHNFIDKCVDAHNELRREVDPPAANMKHMSWDLGLAMVAKAWADKCIYDHNSCIKRPHRCHPTYKFVGENIWKGGIRIFTPRAAVSLWYSEVKYYNYSTLHCSKICGHYTQVVWADTYKVGCAIKICPDLGGRETSIFVCDYGPA
ncbi:GLIPR1-like protein 1 [Saccopteryx bilineata]|uniref:GLIPR1-like protein 1 n=1 Tax=Saccopteryx bilineata TaxID=59482 RepID=UPI00338F9268